MCLCLCVAPANSPDYLRLCLRWLQSPVTLNRKKQVWNIDGCSKYLAILNKPANKIRFYL